MIADPYAILGVDPHASAEEIHAAWRRLSRQFHPDGHVNDARAERAEAERRMIEINEAYRLVKAGPQARARARATAGAGTSPGPDGSPGDRPAWDDETPPPRSHRWDRFDTPDPGPTRRVAGIDVDGPPPRPAREIVRLGANIAAPIVLVVVAALALLPFTTPAALPFAGPNGSFDSADCRSPVYELFGTGASAGVRDQLYGRESIDEIDAVAAVTSTACASGARRQLETGVVWLIAVAGLWSTVRRFTRPRAGAGAGATTAAAG